MIWRPWKGTGPRSAVSQHSPGLLMTHLTRSFPPAWPCKTGPGRSDGFWRKGGWAAFIAAPRPALWPLTPRTRECAFFVFVRGQEFRKTGLHHPLWLYQETFSGDPQSRELAQPAGPKCPGYVLKVGMCQCVPSGPG